MARQRARKGSKCAACKSKANSALRKIRGHLWKKQVRPKLAPDALSKLRREKALANPWFNRPAAPPREKPIKPLKQATAEILFQCQVCKEMFKANSINEAKRRKTCSYACAGKLKRQPPRPSRECDVCGYLFSPKRDDQHCCSRACATQRMAVTHRTNKHRPPPEAKAKAQEVMRSPEYREHQSQINKGRVQKTDKSRRHSARHSRAAVFHVKSPANVTYLVMNITKFVSEHENLFPPDAVVWKRTGKHGASRECRATIGLHSINRGHRGVWRGWMKVGNLEGKENIELLPRTFVEPNS